MISEIKRSIFSALKQSAWLYQSYQIMKARQLEKQYLKTCAVYHRRSLAAADSAPVEQRARALLRWHATAETLARPVCGRLRVLVCGATTKGAARIVPELERSFDTVTVDFGPECRAMEQGDQRARTALQEKILRAFREGGSQGFDLAFFSATAMFVAPETLRTIRATGVPVAVYNMDDKHLFFPDPRKKTTSGQTPLIGCVDVHLTNSRECVRWFVEEGVPALYMPPGVDTEYFKPLPIRKDIDVSFLGAAYGMRVRLLKEIRKAGIPIQCFGNGWGATLKEEDKNALYCRSWINLGIGAVSYSNKITCLKGRDAEVPGSGNVLLTLYNPELADMWQIGGEILCFNNEIDCVEQIRHYLSRKDELLAIGEAARKRAIAQHTWTHRLLAVMAWIRNG